MNTRTAHKVDERESDMRAIKEGWYAMDEKGKLTSGPYSNREDCSKDIARPAPR